MYGKTYQNSVSKVNFCISVGDARYSPWPRLLKQNVFAILKTEIRSRLYIFVYPVSGPSTCVINLTNVFFYIKTRNQNFSLLSRFSCKLFRK